MQILLVMPSYCARFQAIKRNTLVVKRRDEEKVVANEIKQFAINEMIAVGVCLSTNVGLPLLSADRIYGGAAMRRLRQLHASYLGSRQPARLCVCVQAASSVRYLCRLIFRIS